MKASAFLFTSPGLGLIEPMPSSTGGGGACATLGFELRAISTGEDLNAASVCEEESVCPVVFGVGDVSGSLSDEESALGGVGGGRGQA